RRAMLVVEEQPVEARRTGDLGSDRRAEAEPGAVQRLAREHALPQPLHGHLPRQGLTNAMKTSLRNAFLPEARLSSIYHHLCSFSILLARNRARFLSGMGLSREICLSAMRSCMCEFVRLRRSIDKNERIRIVAAAAGTRLR